MQIGRYVQSGMPKIERGRFDLNKACKWIQKFRQKSEEVKRQRIPHGSNFWDEKAKLTALQAEKANDQLLHSRGQLVRTDELLPTVDLIVSSFKDNLLGRGRRIASECFGKTQSQLAQAIEDSDRSILQTLSKGFLQMAVRHSEHVKKNQPNAPHKRHTRRASKKSPTKEVG